MISNDKKFYSLNLKIKTGIEDYDSRLLSIKHGVQSLPAQNLIVLKDLIRHLVNVASECEKNKMEPSNLAIVFGPTLMRAKEETLNSVLNTGIQNRVIENLIIQSEWIFDNEKVETLDP